MRKTAESSWSVLVETSGGALVCVSCGIDHERGLSMKRFVTTALAVFSLAGFSALPAWATPPTSDPGNGHEAAVHNTNANPNACWGQDRSFYASESFFGGSMDIKQSFPPELGKVSDQKAAWIATYC
jgi:hypothetical protein